MCSVASESIQSLPTIAGEFFILVTCHLSYLAYVMLLVLCFEGWEETCHEGREELDTIAKKSPEFIESQSHYFLLTVYDYLLLRRSDRGTPCQMTHGEVKGITCASFQNVSL